MILIVHYDSIGPFRHEPDNPGVDDDMTGMAITLETARLLSQVRNRHYTVRFVASDYEEQANPGLEGARRYAQYIRNLCPPRYPAAPPLPGSGPRGRMPRWG